jgi:predicted nucleotidyltransferase
MNLYLSILKLLIENKDSEFSIRQISILLNKDYKNTYDAVKKISESITLTKKGNASFIKFKPVFTNNIYLVEQFRLESLFNLSLLKQDIDSINNPFFIVILFGSYAKQTQKINSDIDLCIIYDSETELKSIVHKLSVHSKLDLHMFHYSDFIRMLDSKQFNVSHEILNHGIALNNIESYYKVIKHGYKKTA